MSERFEQICSFYSTLDPAHFSEIPELYASNAQLVDPVNDVQGIDGVTAVYDDLFKQLSDISFELHEAIDLSEERSQIILIWTMHYRFRNKKRLIAGSTHLRLNDERKIVLHRDYWDASFSVYGEFPGLGALLRGIRKIVRVKA